MNYKATRNKAKEWQSTLLFAKKNMVFCCAQTSQLEDLTSLRLTGSFKLMPPISLIFMSIELAELLDIELKASHFFWLPKMNCR